MKRVITKNDIYGNSYIVSEDISNIEVPLPDLDPRFKFFNLWTTDAMPVPLEEDDPVKDRYVSTSPAQNGSLFRIVNYPPERVLLDKISQISQMSQEDLIAFEERIGIKLNLNGKHPLMHMTQSIDFGIVLTGEIYLVLDKEEILLKPTDTVIQRGTYHAWNNRSDKDCLMAYVLLKATC